jgi:hypothetical protein
MTRFAFLGAVGIEEQAVINTTEAKEGLFIHSWMLVDMTLLPSRRALANMEEPGGKRSESTHNATLGKHGVALTLSPC